MLTVYPVEDWVPASSPSGLSRCGRDRPWLQAPRGGLTRHERSSAPLTSRYPPDTATSEPERREVPARHRRSSEPVSTPGDERSQVRCADPKGYWFESSRRSPFPRSQAWTRHPRKISRTLTGRIHPSGPSSLLRNARSSASATSLVTARPPRYLSWVIETLACPSWSAIWRAERPAPSSSVAAVLRSTCLVTQAKSSDPRAARSAPSIPRFGLSLFDAVTVRTPSLS